MITYTCNTELPIIGTIQDEIYLKKIEVYQNLQSQLSQTERGQPPFSPLTVSFPSE